MAVMQAPKSLPYAGWHSGREAVTGSNPNSAIDSDTITPAVNDGVWEWRIDANDL
ncbi:hypothetical protein [Methylomonas koyamae]|uniref:hypothetical protein n=1 Tax=Methylomonas koyamae TaxID=702114 RepID=UPI000A5DE4AF|nr:hypothetical protein [Methylomonas koyamae]